MTVVASALFAALAVAQPSQGTLLADEEAMEHFQSAQRAFNEGSYTKASKELEKAFLIEPADALLYPWAQAERFAGHCRIAISLYEKFLATEPSDNFRVAAEENLARCQEQIDEADAASAQSIADGTEDTKVEPLDDGWDDVAAEDTDVIDEPKRKARPRREWNRDPVGGVLAGVGIAGVAAGGALLGIASSRADRVSEEETNQEYLDARRQAVALRNGGAVAVSVGGALLIAGIVRYALLAAKGSQGSSGGARAKLGPWLGGGLGAKTSGVTFRARF